MGLFDWLAGGKPSNSEFAKVFAEALRQAGETKQLRYEPNEFQLVAEGENCHLFNLHNIYHEYCSVPKANRPEALKRFVRSWFSYLKEVPKDFADARHDLLPSVRSRSYSEFARLQMRAQGETKVDWPHRILADHLAISLVYDLPEAMMQVTKDQFAHWGVTFEQALVAGVDNLREISKLRFEMPQPGVWASPYRDNYDTARMLLVDVIRDHPVSGVPVAMIPNRDTLLFTGSEDKVGLENLLKMAEEGLGQARPITGMPFCLVGDAWEPYLPDTDHPLYHKFKLMWVKSIALEYGEQKELLDVLHQKTAQDIFVASFSAVKKRDSEEIFSCSVWSKGVDSLLPRTDRVYFAIANGEESAIAATANWDIMMRIVGDLLESQGLYPERYRVKGFPSDAQQELLKENGPE